MTVDAMIRSAVNYDWISFHSGSDIAIRSRTIIRTFLRKYRGRTEFIERARLVRARFDQFLVGTAVCVRPWELREIQRATRAIYNSSSWNWLSFDKGANWATLSRNFSKAILETIRRHPELIMRIGFSVCSDEHFLQTVIPWAGLNHIRSVTHLRHYRFQGAHPYDLTQGAIMEARHRSNLFARKIAQTGERKNLTAWVEALVDREDRNDSLPPSLQLHL
jgi:hypothetical protein